MLTKESLSKMKVDDIRKYASSLGIKKIRTFKKLELIDEIIKVQNEITSDESVPEKTELETEENEIKSEKVEISEEDRIYRKLKYVENADIGTIVAFKPEIGKVKSAKIIKKSTKNRKLKLETSYGAQFVISYDDVIWVKTTQRWPRGVYNMLKGIV